MKILGYNIQLTIEYIPPAKIKYNGILYDRGNWRGDCLELFKNGCFYRTVAFEKTLFGIKIKELHN